MTRSPLRMLARLLGTLLFVALPARAATAPEGPACRDLFDDPAAWEPVAARTVARVKTQDRVLFLRDHRMAAQARIDLVDAATKRINAAYYEVWPDDGALAHLALLRDAARRGVEVRLLLDGLTMRKMEPEILRSLVAAGVHIKLYHPLSWRFLHKISRRLHDKFLSVDGRYLFVGDRNLSGGYFGVRGSGKAITRSQEALVSGSPAGKADAYFEDVWNSGEVEALQAAGIGIETFASVNARLNRALTWARAALGPRPGIHELLERSTPAGQVAFIHDRLSHKATPRYGIPAPEPGDNLDQILRLIREARHDLLLVNPYIVLTEELKRALLDARARGVRIRLVTNSMRTAGPRLPQVAFEYNLDWFLRNGIEVYEYWRAFELHAKVVVADGEKVYLGSANLDPRSQALNLETGVVFSSREIAGEIVGLVESDLTRYAVRIEGTRGKPTHASGIQCVEHVVLCLFSDVL